MSGEVDDLIQKLEDTNEDVRRSARAALIKIGASAVGLTCPEISSTEYDENPGLYVRFLSVPPTLVQTIRSKETVL